MGKRQGPAPAVPIENVLRELEALLRRAPPYAGLTFNEAGARRREEVRVLRAAVDRVYTPNKAALIQISRETGVGAEAAGEVMPPSRFSRGSRPRVFRHAFGYGTVSVLEQALECDYLCVLCVGDALRMLGQLIARVAPKPAQAVPALPPAKAEDPMIQLLRELECAPDVVAKIGRRLSPGKRSASKWRTRAGDAKRARWIVDAPEIGQHVVKITDAGRAELARWRARLRELAGG